MVFTTGDIFTKGIKLKFYLIFPCFCRLLYHSYYDEQNCHVLVMTLYNLILANQHINGRKTKILLINQKSEEIIHIYPIFCAFGGFIAMSLRGNGNVWLGCTRTWSPAISTVLH